MSNILSSTTVEKLAVEILEKEKEEKKNASREKATETRRINKEKKEAQQDLARRFNERTSSYHKELLTELLEEN